MLDPCLACTGCAKAALPRKVDCLAPFANLRAIGNSRGGFKACNTSAGWSPSEKAFYDRQIKTYYRSQTLPGIL